MIDVLLVALPLVLFVALALMFVLVLRRTAALAAESRANDAFRRGAIDVAARAAAALDDASGRLDGVRLSGTDPTGTAAAADAARALLAQLRGDAAALRAPGRHGPVRSSLVDELDRAIAALDAGSRASAGVASNPDDGDAQTGIKRSYLSVLHARDGLLEIARDLGSAVANGVERSTIG